VSELTYINSHIDDKFWLFLLLCMCSMPRRFFVFSDLYYYINKIKTMAIWPVRLFQVSVCACVILGYKSNNIYRGTAPPSLKKKHCLFSILSRNKWTVEFPRQTHKLYNELLYISGCYIIWNNLLLYCFYRVFILKEERV
jgi:hypothetical protein